MMPIPLIDILDQRFGFLTVLYREPGRKHASTIWMCLCDCGNYKRATRRKLETKGVVSCGMHTRSYTPEFYQQAGELWRDGNGRYRIGRALGVTPNVIAGLMWRNPDLFPPREWVYGT